MPSAAAPFLLYLCVLLAALQPAQAQQVEWLGNASVTGFVISIVMMILMCSCCAYMAYLECVVAKKSKEEGSSA